MDSMCNFKLFDPSILKTFHVFCLSVECYKYADEYSGYFYSVVGNAFDTASAVSIPHIRISDGKRFAASTFNTPKEAFDFLDKVAEKYPKYGDDRDYDIEFAPVYEGVEI